ncbi:MAG: cysteine desulfurase family protein [Bacteroidota bacterium]
MIYLDYAATTPISASALEAYRQASLRFFGNASSLHDAGTEAERALEGARRAIASLLEVSPDGLFFTGCGSEANFLALTSLALSRHSKGRHIITSTIEHSSVRNSFHWLESNGFEVTRISTDGDGVIQPEMVRDALREDTVLVSIQHVNSEVGTIHPLEEIGALLRDHQALFHSDLVQSFGKLQLLPGNLHLDSFTISAHKVHGPKGLGAAWISPKHSWRPFIPETIHEHGFRPGTVDVPAVAAFAVAARESFAKLNDNLTTVRSLKEAFLDALGGEPEVARVEGENADSSPYILGLSTRGMEGQYAMLESNQRGVAFSTGSACQVNEQKPSPTLLSMGRNEEEARQFVRISFDPELTERDVRRAGEILRQVIEEHLQLSKSVL